MVKNIFIIEDDERNMKLFKAVLNLIPDIELFTETDGDRGLELIKSGDPHLVILDIQIPGKTGIEICTEIRKIEEYEEIPIIAVTSFAMKGDRERIMQAGFTEYVSKPIKVMEFRELVRRLLEQK